jgi:alpha-L-rhamnosidase
VAVELFDLESRKLIAPVKVFRDLSGGAYAVYACRQSVRIRANQLRGDNAVLSGLFFDP